MTCRQYGLYTRVRELQSKFGYVFFDGDDLADSFLKEPEKVKPRPPLNPKTGKPWGPRRFGTSRDTVYDDCASLLKKGWFVELTARTRKKDGTWEARKLKALSHKEWVAKHPDKCLIPQDSQSVASDWPSALQATGSSPLQAIDQCVASDHPVRCKPDDTPC